MSSSSSSSRLRKDIQRLYASPPSDIILPESVPSDLTQLTLFIIGPVGTPFEGHEFQIALKIPSDYPAQPPTVAFRTKIFHPNIHPGNGDVCVDTLKRDWMPTLDLIQILITIRCLLIEPNPASALNEEAGKAIIYDWEGWFKKAKLMARVHAPRTTSDKLITQIDDSVIDSSSKGGPEETIITSEHELNAKHVVLADNLTPGQVIGNGGLTLMPFLKKKKPTKKRIGLRRL